MILQRSRSVHPIGQPRPRMQCGALKRSPWSWCILSVVGLATVMRQASGQVPTSSLLQSQEGATLPQPLVSASFVPPAHSINWPAYHHWEECQAAFERMRDMAKYEAFLPGMSANRSTDTLHWGGAFPLDSTVVRLPRACLSQFRVSQAPVPVLENVRRFVSGVNADSLFQAIVVQQLATLPLSAIQPRAELLEAVILELLDRNDVGYGNGISTQAHLRMVRTYITQLDSLGPAAWRARLRARTWFLDQISRQTYDLEAQLALLQEERQILQQPAVQQLREMQVPSGFLNLTQGEIEIRQIDDAILEVHYYQTLAPDSLAKLEQHRDDIAKHFGIDFPAPLRWLSVHAPPLQCAYYFPTPQAITPQTGSPPILPLSGQLSLLVFYNRGIYYDQDNVVTMLRRVHRDLPALPITFIDHTMGMFGAMSGQDVVQDPAREAVLLHHEIVDTLGFAGSLCVSISQSKKTPEGHVMLASDVNSLAYHHKAGLGWMVYIVDPTGTVVGSHDFGINNDPGGLQGGIAFEWYLKRLATKYGIAQPPH